MIENFANCGFTVSHSDADCDDTVWRQYIFAVCLKTCVFKLKLIAMYGQAKITFKLLQTFYRFSNFCISYL